jgi:predicted signal transduction protein with EAL and GGDEF domain
MEKLAKQEIDQKTLNHLAERMDAQQDAIIKAFQADTDRFKAVQPVADPAALQEVVRQTILEVLSAPSPSQAVESGLSGAAAMGIGLSATDLGKPIHAEVPQ